MNPRNRGFHRQRSFSPPPDLLSSILQQPPPPPSQSPPFTSNTPLSSSPSDQQTPHVSRINARLSSIHDGADSKGTIFNSFPFAQDESSTNNIGYDVSMFSCSNFDQTSTSSSVSSSISYNGRWCEKERAIPLKKRRVVMVSYESNQSEEETMERNTFNSKGNGKCNDRKNGKGLRYSKIKVKGRRLCRQHVENMQMQRMKKKQRKMGSSVSLPFAGRPKSNYQMKESKRVKVRSIRSLLRDTVPLLRGNC